jgi:CHAT domain-containing protein
MKLLRIYLLFSLSGYSAFTKMCLISVILQIGFFNVFSQQGPTNFAFLAKLNKLKIIEWAQLKPKEELIEASNYLIWVAEKSVKENNLKTANTSSTQSLLIAELSNDFFTLGKINYLRGRIILESNGENANQLASDCFRKANEYFYKLDKPNSKVLLGKSLLEIANISIKSPLTTDYSDALKNVSTSYNLALEVNSAQLLGLTYKTLGLYFFYKEEYSNSLASFEHAVSLLKIEPDYDSLLEIETFSTYLFRNLSIRELTSEDQKKTDNLLKQSTSKLKKIAFLFAKGGFYNSNGDSVSALRYFRLAQKIARELDATNILLSFQYTIGKTLLWEGDNLSAERELRQVIDIAKKQQKPHTELIRRCYIGLAVALERQEKISVAKEIFNQVGTNLGDDPNTKYNYYFHFAQFLISQNSNNVAKQYLNMAEKEISSNFGQERTHINFLKLWLDYKTKTISPAETIKNINQSISQIKDEQLNTQNIGINLNYLDEFIFPFHFKTLVQFEKGDFESALLDSDSYKSRWLISKMVSDKNFGTVNKSWIVSDEAVELRNKIFNRLLISGLKGEEKSDIELQNLLKTHDEKLNQRQDVSSLTEKFKKTEISNIELKELTATLSEKVILEYSFTNEFLTVFVIKQNQPVKAFKISISERLLKEKITKWCGEIVGQDLGFKKESHELYDLLIKPIEAEIKNSTGLIIIPEGILWKLPFQALLNSQKEYLIQKSAISYVPSLKILQTIQKGKAANPNSKKNVVGFGNPINESTKSLPEAENEVKNLSSIYPSSISFIREKATETTLKIEMEKANVLHLAVHGKLDEIEPLRSSIILTKDTKNDGNFEIEEIISLNKSPELVILSACSTNNGQVFKGEGLLSLTWAFLVAGSKNVIGTQWEIDDKTTSEEMQLFHQMYSKNNSIAESLQFAVLKQIEKKGIQNHPFYWAGFVSVGGF